MSKEDFHNKLQVVLDGYLEDYSFEDFLEEFDLTPLDVLICAFDNGLVDEDLFETYMVSVDG